MNSRNLRIWSVRLLRFLVGATFLYAGSVKTVYPARFITDVYNYHLVSWPVAVGLAFYLPWLELLSGLALLFGWLYRGAIAILLALTAIFIIASISAKFRGINVICGCFGGASRNLSFVSHIALDLLLLGAIAMLWVIDQKARAPIIKGR